LKRGLRFFSADLRVDDLHKQLFGVQLTVQFSFLK